MGEFELIDAIVRALGSAGTGPQVICGPGDDSSIVRPLSGCDAVASIDTLLPGVHFPVGADPREIGYRSLAVSLSDLSAMAAAPGYVLVALTLRDASVTFVEQLAEGMAEAAGVYDVPIVGGNLARGPLSIAVSVHGWAVPDTALLRSGASVGDTLFVTGPLGGTAAALAAGIDSEMGASVASDLRARYFRPPNRGPLMRELAGRRLASAAIDISDGLLADAGHLSQKSQVALDVDCASIPIFRGATLAQVLAGSDDYEILFCSDQTAIDNCTAIGRVVAAGDTGPCVAVDGQAQIRDGSATAGGGFDHFRADT